MTISAPQDDDVSWVRFSGDFRARLATAGVIAAPTVGNGLRSDLRSEDATVTWAAFHLLRCAFTASDGDLHHNRDGDQCDGELAGNALMRSRRVIDGLLADLRVRAGIIGSAVIEDVRCYGASDGYRVWCEAAAVLPDSQSARRGEE